MIQLDFILPSFRIEISTLPLQVPRTQIETNKFGFKERFQTKLKPNLI